MQSSSFIFIEWNFLQIWKNVEFKEWTHQIPCTIQHPHVLHCADNKSVRHLSGPLTVSNDVRIQLLVGDRWLEAIIPFDLLTYNLCFSRKNSSACFATLITNAIQYTWHHSILQKFLWRNLDFGFLVKRPRYIDFENNKKVIYNIILC